MKQHQEEKIILYYKIKQLLQAQYKITEISKMLSISRTTIYSYKKMDEEKFLVWMQNYRKKVLKLARFENEIREQLIENPKISSYQIHRLLLEKHPNLKVSRRAISDFVKKLKYDISDLDNL